MEKLNDDTNEPRNNQQQLEAVLTQFEQWRAEKVRGERIPQHLWQAAASLYPKFSVNQIARSLRLDSMDLRDYVHPARRKYRSKPHAVPHFMPLAVGPSGGLADCRIEMKDGSKARLRIRLKGVGVGPLAELLRELWSRGA
jgi:hypothetical protein